ncbi:MAG: TonB-dependent receptor [Porticoccaceae bacterium]|nr:MAG: TonB-dependent receptor [Porticoccaceae bacterium]
MHSTATEARRATAPSTSPVTQRAAAWATLLALCSSPALSADSPALEEIVVTAQRRAERLEEVPLTVAVASGEELRKAGVDRLEDVANFAAGTQVVRAGAFSQPSIRGISTLILGNGLENNVAVYVDGVYQPDAIAINADLAHVESVQILKGPQGTLYGRNATAGAIVVETLDPEEEWGGALEAEAARFDERALSARLIGPLAEGLAFLIAGSYREADGYLKDAFDGDPVAPLESETLRAKLRWHPGDDLELSLRYAHVSHLDARGLTYRLSAYPLIPGSPAEIDRIAQNVESDNTAEVDELSYDLRWETALGTLRAIGAYADRDFVSNFDFDGTTLDLVRSIGEQIDQDTWQQSVDFNVTALAGWEITLGGMYYRDHYRQDDTESWQFNVLQYTYDVETEAEAWAGYLDATWEFLPDLFVTFGARYSVEERRGAYRVDNFTGPPVPPADKDHGYDAFTPRVALRYSLNEGENLYLSWSEGFRSGTYYTASQPDPSLYNPVDQEEIRAWEVGYKRARASHRLSVAAFYYDYRDLQVGLTVPNPIGTGVIQQIFNAPEAEVYGAEGELQWLPVENLSLRAALAWVHGEYTDFPNATGVGLDPAGPRNVSPQPQDWSGKQMARAPEWTASLGADYAVNCLGGTLELSGNARYTSSYVNQNLSLYGPLAGPRLAGKQRYRQPSFWLVNLQVAWRAPGDRWSIALYGKNLTNERYYLTYSGSSLGDYAIHAWPRTWGLRGSWEF